MYKLPTPRGPAKIPPAPAQNPTHMPSKALPSRAPAKNSALMARIAPPAKAKQLKR